MSGRKRVERRRGPPPSERYHYPASPRLHDRERDRERHSVCELEIGRHCEWVQGRVTVFGGGGGGGELLSGQQGVHLREEEF